MGVCCSRNCYSHRSIPSANKLAYYRTIRLQIHINKTPNFADLSECLTLSLSNPEQVCVGKITQGRSDFFYSTCVIPGGDVWQRYQRECSDISFTVTKSDSLFIGIFDGHGKNGRKVASFCKKRAIDSFHKSIPVAEIPRICEDQLRLQGEFDKSSSGATALFVLIDSFKLYTANVGNSKAVLASVVKGHSEESKLIDNPILEVFRHNRRIPRSILHPIVLTKSHTPEVPEEVQRIKEAGGFVRKFVIDGVPTGPFKVWPKDCSRPGLSVSRTLGNTFAQKIGVISEPTLMDVEIDPEEHMFLVVASDGLWNVMDPQEVIDYIQAFRAFGLTEMATVPEISNPYNTCIAHLLCEEARLRWLALVEEEDTGIDDIACTVVEFNKLCFGKKASCKDYKKKQSPQAYVKSETVPIKQNKPRNISKK